jgi:hypothetical protein
MKFVGVVKHYGFFFRSAQVVWARQGADSANKLCISATAREGVLFDVPCESLGALWALEKFLSCSF